MEFFLPRAAMKCKLFKCMHQFGWCFKNTQPSFRFEENSMTTTTYILINCYPLASRQPPSQNIPTECFQKRTVLHMVPTLQIMQLAKCHAAWGGHDLHGPVDLRRERIWISDSITLQNLTELAPLQHPPWLWLPGLSQTCFR